MKVGIIGAGIAGLSCAHFLERNGVFSHVYERNHRIGNLFTYGEIVLNLMTRPYDSLEIMNRMGISLQPLSTLKRLVIKSPKNKVEIKGKLGYIFERGQGENSVENQIAKNLTSKIFFNINANYESLMKEYDHVVIATGNSMMAKSITEWENIVSASIKGGIAIGNFEPDTVYVWFDRSYANSGFGYLVPLGPKKASLVLVVTYSLKEEVENMWQEFLSKEKINFSMVETFESELEIGMPRHRSIGKVYLVGNAGGFLDSAFGFGLINSMMSSFYCSFSIVKGYNYEEKVLNLQKKLNNLRKIRERMDTGTNEDIERLIGLMKNPLVKTLVYNTNIDIFSYLPFFMKFGTKKPGKKPGL
ncbi:NAD(P)-binding protein [Caldanaerobacter sp.]|uniref:NAD(P)-binding protein n=1 Tax=Caldanaerobacter sp. TaxID=2930036 RepID=UPI003C775304